MSSNQLRTIGLKITTSVRRPSFLRFDPEMRGYKTKYMEGTFVIILAEGGISGLNVSILVGTLDSLTRRLGFYRAKGSLTPRPRMVHFYDQSIKDEIENDDPDKGDLDLIKSMMSLGNRHHHSNDFLRSSSTTDAAFRPGAPMTPPPG